MVSKVVYGFFIKSYEHFKISKLDNRRPRTNAENGSKNSLTENTSQPRGKLVKFSKKIQSKKCDFRCKNMKNTESPKMALKSLWGFLIKSYEQFKFFLKSGQFIKPSTYAENGIKIHLEI